MEKQARILVTGASGMIGSAVVRFLKAQGFQQLLVPTHDALDLRQQTAVADYFAHQRPAYVFHLAARVGGIQANRDFPAEFIVDNTAMQSNVMAAAHANKVVKLLFPGSACTYPKFAAQPVAESAFLGGLIEPTNLAYAAAKINGIVMAQSYRQQYGFNAIVPMPTNAYGIGDNFDPIASHVIPALMLRFYEAAKNSLSEVVMWGSGTPLREFIYVDDVASAMVFLMQHYDEPGIINLGSMQEITMTELAQKIAEVVGYRGRITLDTSKPDGVPRKCLDSSRLYALGWRPSIGLEEGLQRMYAHHFPA